MESTSITVTPEARDELAHVKYELGFRNYSQTIEHLVEEATTR